MKHCIKHLLLEMFDLITILRHMVTLTAKKLLLLFFVIVITVIKLCFNPVFLKNFFSMKPPYLWNTWNCIFKKMHMFKFISN